MKCFLSFLFVPLLSIAAWADVKGGGITPEQIYQPRINWVQVMGTWEVLPDDNPLREKGTKKKKPAFRSLMTLRGDGTCRIFDKAHPDGSDGLWTYKGHKIFIRFPQGGLAEYFVYGVKGDFMITRSPILDGKDQLWSRVK